MIHEAHTSHLPSPLYTTFPPVRLQPLQKYFLFFARILCKATKHRPARVRKYIKGGKFAKGLASAEKICYNDNERVFPEHQLNLRTEGIKQWQT